MNELQTFNFEGADVRTVTIEDEPYFVGKDVANILGYKNGSRDINNHVDEEDKLKYQISTAGQIREQTVVNESGLYSLILGSKLPSAKKFKRWVTSEVLPTIRKHGAYLTDQKAYDIVTNKEALADLMTQAADQLREKDVQIERLTAELEVANKKANYVDVIIESKDDITTTQIAQDYGMTAIKFNRLLHEVGVQRKVNTQWILYAKYQGRGYIDSRTTSYKGKDGRLHSSINTT